jgi:hypothetical protein
MADSDYFRENGYDFLVNGGDVPDDWGDNEEKQAFVSKKQTGGDVPDDSWMEHLWAWADEYNFDKIKLPRDKLGVTNLQNLDLSSNKLTELPKEIGQLTNLKILKLSNNKLTELPKEIGQITNLQELYLFDNMLTELPEEIGQLTNLKILSLSRNKFTDLPKEIGQLTNLKSLRLSSNNLTGLPTAELKEIGQLTNLQELFLYDNLLRELPKEIGQLTNLKNLSIIANMLTELPKEIGQLTNLKILKLSHNKLTELPKEIGQLTNLKILKLSHNKFTELPKEIGQITNLQELYLQKGLWPADTFLPRGLLLDNTWSSKSKVQRYLNEKIFYICAVDSRGSTSKAIKIELMNKGGELPKEFVLRLYSTCLPSGNDLLEIVNADLQIFSTFTKAYLEPILKGFRRIVEGNTYLLVKLQTENLKVLTEQEEKDAAFKRARDAEREHKNNGTQLEYKAREELMSKVTYLDVCTVLQTEEEDIRSLCVTEKLYEILKKHMRDYNLQTTFFNHGKGVERYYTYNYYLQRTDRHSASRYYIKQGGRSFPRSVNDSTYRSKTVKVCTPFFEDMCHGILRDYRSDVLYINR